MAAPGGSVPGSVAEINELVRRSQEEDLVSVVMVPIQSLARAFREQQNREEATQSVFEVFAHILTRQLAAIKVFTENSESGKNEQYETCLQLIAECFRCLRNACIQCVKNQSHIRTVGLIDPTVQILQLLRMLRGFESDTLSAAFQCGLQFLGNLAVGNEESKDVIWKNAFPDLFLNCLNHLDKKTVTYCCMVLFTCLNGERTADLLNHTKGIELAETVVKICRKEPELDWAFLIVTEQFLKCPDLVSAMYTKWNSQERIIILELISAKLSDKNQESQAGSDDLAVPVRLMQFLAACFIEKYMAVLKYASATEAEDEEALIVIRLLDILCETTSNHEKFSYLQNSPALVETTIKLLYETHLAGKQSRNIFTASQSLSFANHTTHPAVGFKAHLIHLIGNLCYNNKENQEKVRHLGGIPLILDNCNIDDNNPFVSQWAVFAIRILTEQNAENQEVISQMVHQGIADNAVLNSMGLRVEEQNGKLYIKSQEKCE
ncbi:ataxin-10 isoform X2 [Pristis pectinata]|uniref:ataxin-10 isoform X2 n=1 Tax=Pristis pectinata TaxID=685728 RepID=UPI00223DAEE8|nr:ataxin-10 isoform X2 [Pristis pectinata]